MLCFLVYFCSLNLVLAYLSPSAVGLDWDATGRVGRRSLAVRVAGVELSERWNFKS